MAIKATLDRTKGVTGSVSEGQQPQVTRVTVPGPKGTAGANTATSFRQLTDVDDTDLADGAMIQYDATSEKFQIKTEISTDTGEIRLNGGTF